MGKHSVERKLRKAGARLRTLRDELVVIDEQLAHLVEDAEAKSLRALVADSPAAAIEHREAAGHSRGDGRASASRRRRDPRIWKPDRTNYSMNFAYSDPVRPTADSTRRP